MVVVDLDFSQSQNTFVMQFVSFNIKNCFVKRRVSSGATKIVGI